MNDKKIVGNGSKATLPGGKKMEDYKKPPAYNSLAKTNAMSSSGNNSEQIEEKQKSKGEQVAQTASSEALKAGLKASFPYIPQFIINKLVDSKLGQALIEKTLKKTKRKIIFAVIGIAGTVLMWLFFIVMILSLILGPLGWILEIAEAMKNLGLSVFNFAIGKGWCTDEESCEGRKQTFYYERLNAEAEDYYKNCKIEFNQELITATIFYDRMVRENDEDIDNEGKPVADQFDDSEDKYYSYTQDDIDEIDNLGKVYKNQGSAVTCPLAKLDDYKDIGKDIADMLDKKYTEGQLDQFLITWRGKVNKLTLEDLTTEFKEAVSGNKSFWEDILARIKSNASCFDYVFNGLKQTLNPKSKCEFNVENYKNYLTNYYIPDHYIYLTKSPYNMTKEEIADEILLLGEVNYNNKSITIVEGTDGLFTMLPDGLSLGVSSNPANCRCHPIKNVYESHKGVDISGAPYGTSILALEDGVISQISIKNTVSCGSSIIKLKHVDTNGEIYYTRYVHLNRASNALLSTFKVGDAVTKGQVIGYVGGLKTEDSCSTGPHLHFEVHNSTGNPINPLVALNNYNSGLPVSLNQEIISVCSANGKAC